MVYTFELLIIFSFSFAGGAECSARRHHLKEFASNRRNAAEAVRIAFSASTTSKRSAKSNK